MGLQLSGAFNLYAYLCGGNGYRESKGNFIMGVLSGAMPQLRATMEAIAGFLSA